jgi:hypothetical protein
MNGEGLGSRVHAATFAAAVSGIPSLSLMARLRPPSFVGSASANEDAAAGTVAQGSDFQSHP